MRRLQPALVLVAVLVAGASTGCSDEQMREAGRRIEEAVGQRWEAWRQGVDKDIKARVRREAEARARAHGRSGASAVRAPEETPAPPAKAKALDRAALAEIVAIAERQHAQSLTVKQFGKVVLDRHWGHQDDLHAMMQMTYPIVALTMGQLVAEQKVPSLDAPLGRWLPAFRQGKKRRVTLRDVMTGRDGLPHAEPWPAGLYGKPDYVGFFSGVDLQDEPGRGQVLPQESVVLLGAVVEAAAGMPLDRWVATRLLEPLGISKSRWRKDKAGHVDAWAGLWLPPAGALRIGELVLNEGRWNGRQVLPRDWVVEATSPAGRSALPDYAEDHGYGWRVGNRVLFRKQDVARLEREGYSQAEATRPAVGGVYRSHAELQLKLLSLVGKEAMLELAKRRDRVGWIPCRFVADRRYGFQAGDYIGNHLIVNPAKHLVALHTVPWDGRPVTRNIATFEYDDLANRLDAASE